MTRSLSLFNILLALVSLILLGLFFSSIFDHRSLAVARRQKPTAQEVPKRNNKVLPLRPRHRSLSYYDTILKQDPFRNPVAKPAKEPTAPTVAYLPPLPALSGTIFVGAERRAILKDGNRQVIYGIGESVGGGTLVKIEQDRVVIRRGKNLSEVHLKSAIKKGPPPALQSRQTTKGSPKVSPTSPQRLSERWEDQRSEKAKRRQERIRRAYERLLPQLKRSKEY